MMSYGSEIFLGGSDNVLEWDKPQCIFRFEKKVFLNDPNAEWLLQGDSQQESRQCNVVSQNGVSGGSGLYSDNGCQ